MKKLMFRLAAGSVLLVLAGFLVLTYITMYKQNHAIPILEYHNISEFSECEDWSVSKEDFNQQMDYLNQHCRVVPLEELLEDMRQGRAVPRNTVALTFDDGYRSNYEIAFPVLQKYNFPATIFIVVKSIEKGFIGDYPALQWTDMKVMQNSGLIKIESHTYDLHEEIPESETGKTTPSAVAHLLVDGKPESEAQHELRIETDLKKSRQIIEEQLGRETKILSWPFGAYGPRELAIAKKVGFTATSARVAYSHPSTKPEDFARVAVLSGTTMEEFSRMVQPRQVDYFQAIKLEVERIKYHLRRISA